MKLRGIREARDYDKIHKRLSSANNDVVLQWADQTLWATQAGLDGVRVTYDAAAVEEARRGAVGLLAALDVLQVRLTS